MDILPCRYNAAILDKNGHVIFWFPHQGYRMTDKTASTDAQAGRRPIGQKAETGFVTNTLKAS